MNSRGMEENIPPNIQEDDDGSSLMDYGLLIDLVSKYPILYDMRTKDYKNTQLKDSCWQQIGQMMGQSAPDCSARWSKLKDCYRREKRKRTAETKSGSGATNRRGFAFYQQMSFIENCPNKRKSHTNVLSSHAPVPVKKSFYGYQLTPPYSSVSELSFLSDDAARTYTELMIPTAASATPTSSDNTTLATGSLLTTSTASQIVASFFQTPSTTSGTPELCSESTTDLNVDSYISLAAPQEKVAPLSTWSGTSLSGTVSIPTQSPITAKPVLSSSNTTCITTNPGLTSPAVETASTVTFATPAVYDEFTTSLTSPVQDRLTNVARRYSGGPISTTPTLLTPNASRTPTPTSNFHYFGSPSASVSSSPGPASPISFSCSSNFDTPKSCFNKDSIKKKKIDPLEASFMSLSTAMQNKLQNPGHVESKKNLTSDEIFGNLIASELTNMTADGKIKKKTRILEILFQED